MRTHTEEKPYSCKVCDARYNTLLSFKRHLAVCDPKRINEYFKKRRFIKRIDLVEEDKDGLEDDGVSSDGKSQTSEDEHSISANTESNTSDTCESSSNEEDQCSDMTVRKPQTKRKKITYVFFENETFIGEYSV